MDDYIFPKDLLFKIPPYQYLHVLNRNTNVVTVQVGPKTHRCKEEEKVVYGPSNMIIIPPGQYVIVDNPVCKDKKGDIILDKYGQAKLNHGDQEVRLEQDPFPLYPGEKISGRIQPLQVVAPIEALRLQAVRDFSDKNGKPFVAGQEWLFLGPGTYIPQKEIRVVHTVKATVLQPNQALHLRARKQFKDFQGIERRAGEEWLIKREGAYLPDVDEVVLRTVNAYVLTDKTALHLRAAHSFVDIFGKNRKAGEEWLVVRKDCETHIPDVYEIVVGEVSITSLTKRQWCIIQDPVEGRLKDDDEVSTPGAAQLGKQLFVRGEKNFFLQPGESLVGMPRDVIVLGEEQALLVRAIEEFNDTVGEKKTTIIKRKPGDRWLIYGPQEYWPPLQVQVVKHLHPFIKVEALHLFYFQPEAVILSVVIVLFLFFLFLFKLIY